MNTGFSLLCRESSMRNLVYYLLWTTEDLTGIVEFFLIFLSVLGSFVVSIGFKSSHLGIVALVSF